MPNPRQLAIALLFAIIAFVIGSLLVNQWGENIRLFILIAVFIYYIIWYQRYRQK